MAWLRKIDTTKSIAGIGKELLPSYVILVGGEIIEHVQTFKYRGNTVSDMRQVDMDNTISQFSEMNDVIRRHIYSKYLDI
jgi:hypothetical protein